MSKFSQISCRLKTNNVSQLSRYQQRQENNGLDIPRAICRLALFGTSLGVATQQGNGCGFKFNFPPASVTPSVTNGNGQFVWIFCFSPVQNKSYPSLNNTLVVCVLFSSVVYFINFKDRRSTWNYKKEKKVVKSHKVLDRSR